MCTENPDKMDEPQDEIIVLGCIYHLYAFTDYMPFLKLRSKIGWSIISLVFLNIIVNFVSIIYMS